MIYLTAGHHVVNGKGTGAHGVQCKQYPSGFDEAREAIVLRDLIAAECRRLGFPITTEPDDKPLSKVLAWLRSVAGADDTCVEIHFNAGPPNATGTEAVVQDNHTLVEQGIAIALCRAIHDTSGIRIRERKKNRRGVLLESETARGRIGFLRSPKVATNVLLEVCSCTSKSDVDKYFTNRSKIAKAIAEHLIWIG